MDELDDDEFSSLVSAKLTQKKFGYVHVFSLLGTFLSFYTKIFIMV
jgi:hypothetical protein